MPNDAANAASLAIRLIQRSGYVPSLTGTKGNPLYPFVALPSEDGRKSSPELSKIPILLELGMPCFEVHDSPA
jgi:hypothetical protein